MSDTRGSAGAVVVGVLAIVIFAVAAPFALQATLEDTTTDHSVTNESFVPDNETWIALENSNIPRADYYDNETVRNSTDATMVEGTDYEWSTTNGSIKPLDGGDLANESDATISYAWEGQTERQAGAWDVTADTGALLGAAAFVGLLLLMVLALAALGRA